MTAKRKFTRKGGAKFAQMVRTPAPRKQPLPPGPPKHPDVERHYMRKVGMARRSSSLMGAEDQLSLMCCRECSEVSFFERQSIHSHLFGSGEPVRMYSIAELSGDLRRIPCSWCGRSAADIDALNVEHAKKLA